VAAWLWTYKCTYTCKLNTALCFTCRNICMFGIHIKGQETIGCASSGNSNNKSGLIPDIIIDVYHCNQLIQRCRQGLSVSWRSATVSTAVRCIWTELLALVFMYERNLQRKYKHLTHWESNQTLFCIVCMLLQQSVVWLGAMSEWMTSPSCRKLQVSVAAWPRLATASHWMGH